VIGAAGLAPRLADRAVYAAWSSALGPRYASHARPVAFRSGELRVEVDSASHLHDLKGFTGEEFRSRANAQLGQEKIRRVVYKLGGRS
jgi:hypothetical protein